MDQVISANGSAIAITGNNNYFQLRTGKFDPCRKWNSSPVCCMDRIKIQLARRTGGTADSGNNSHFFLPEFQVVNGSRDITHQNSVPAPGTPYMRKMINPHGAKNEITGFYHAVPH